MSPQVDTEISVTQAPRGGSTLASVSHLPGELKLCQCLRQGGLSQNRVETLIGTQAKHEIKTNIRIYFYYKIHDTTVLKAFNVKLTFI